VSDDMTAVEPEASIFAAPSLPVSSKSSGKIAAEGGAGLRLICAAPDA
jgi:hypothetical protein